MPSIELPDDKTLFDNMGGETIQLISFNELSCSFIICTEYLRKAFYKSRLESAAH